MRVFAKDFDFSGLLEYSKNLKVHVHLVQHFKHKSSFQLRIQIENQAINYSNFLVF